VHSSYNGKLRFTTGQSVQYILFCSSFDLLYDEVRHHQRFEHMPLISGPSYTFDTSE